MHVLSKLYRIFFSVGCYAIYYFIIYLIYYLLKNRFLFIPGDFKGDFPGKVWQKTYGIMMQIYWMWSRNDSKCQNVKKI